MIEREEKCTARKFPQWTRILLGNLLNEAISPVKEVKVHAKEM